MQVYIHIFVKLLCSNFAQDYDFPDHDLLQVYSIVGINEAASFINKSNLKRTVVRN